MWLIPLAVAAYLARTIAIAVLRPRHPDAADAVNRWWIWTPLVAVLVVVAVLLVLITWNTPLLGITLTIGVGIAVYRGFFSASSVGSPFRPRR